MGETSDEKEKERTRYTGSSITGTRNERLDWTRLQEEGTLTLKKHNSNN